MNIDIGRSVTYPFEDPKWTTKLGILLLIGFVPGLNFIIWGGYSLSIARNMYRRVSLPLPEWSEWSDIAVRGLLAIVATALYFLPVILLQGCMLFGGLLFDSRDNGLFSIAQCCSSLFTFMYIIAASLLLTVAHSRYSQIDQFNVYLDIGGRIRDLQTNLTPFLTLFVIQTIVGIMCGMLTGILVLVCIGISVGPMLAILVNGFLMGSTLLAIGFQR
jgi:hypothetical protein